MAIADTQLKEEDKTQSENIIAGAMRITGVKVTYYLPCKKRDTYSLLQLLRFLRGFILSARNADKR